MKISFQTIVFNAEAILPYNMLRLCIGNVIPYAHEIIIVEGATKASNGHYWDGDTSPFTRDGHSVDKTILILKDLQTMFPDKIKIITSDGFWPGKTAMCNAAAEIATGDYIWQLDSDEFYHRSDMEKIIELLEKEQPNRVDFWANHFWGGFDYCIDERESGWGNNPSWKRIFKHTPRYSYWISHEPPVYRDCESGLIIDRNKTLDMGIKLFHYSYVQKSQIDFKTKFYDNPHYPQYWELFKKDKSARIFGSKVYLFTSEHPKIIKDYYGL